MFCPISLLYRSVAVCGLKQSKELYGEDKDP
jgi:hypothetical protein